MELSRAISDEFLAEIKKSHFYPVALAYVDWPSGPIYAHTGVGPLDWDEQIWQGVGEYGAIEAEPDYSSGVPTELSLTIVGPVAEVLSEIDDTARGSEAQVYLGATTKPGGNVIVGNPLLVFSGGITRDELVHEGEDMVSLKITIKGGEFDRAGGDVVHSDEDQQVKHPGDTLFRRVANAERWRTNPIQWPAP